MMTAIVFLFKVFFHIGQRCNCTVTLWKYDTPVQLCHAFVDLLTQNVVVLCDTEHPTTFTPVAVVYLHSIIPQSRVIV